MSHRIAHTPLVQQSQELLKSTATKTLKACMHRVEKVGWGGGGGRIDPCTYVTPDSNRRDILLYFEVCPKMRGIELLLLL